MEEPDLRRRKAVLRGSRCSWSSKNKPEIYLKISDCNTITLCIWQTVGVFRRERNGPDPVETNMTGRLHLATTVQRESSPLWPSLF